MKQVAVIHTAFEETPRTVAFVDVPDDMPVMTALEYAYKRTNNIEGSWSKGETFEWEGETHCLEAERRDDKLFFNFRDLTNGDTTYGAGRFLYAPLPQDGEVILDFNQATNLITTIVLF